MVTVELNEKSAEDVKAIMELKKMGVPDELIQRLYENSCKVIQGSDLS